MKFINSVRDVDDDNVANGINEYYNVNFSDILKHFFENKIYSSIFFIFVRNVFIILMF